MFGAMSGSKTAPSSPSAAHAGGPSVTAKKGHVIVIGNEKGGSGKTTTTMHLIVGLLRLGFTIGSIDIDSRQRSLTRYVENRQNMASREGVKLPMPQHVVVTRSPFGMQEEAEADERDRFGKAINKLMANNDFVVIDSPGSDTYLSRFAHSFADTIITPINDSFVDLDVLATVDGTTLKIVRPSIYSEMVWEQKLLRAKRDGGSIEWIVMRNRLSNIDARNKRFMGQVLAELSRRIGFRAAPGFSERVIFREMFLQGLTVLDVMDNGANTSISLSHVAARQEVRDLLKTLRIPQIDERVASLRTGTDGENDSADTVSEAQMHASKEKEPATIRPAQARSPQASSARATAPQAAPPIAQPISKPVASAGAPGFAPPPPPPGSQKPAVPAPAARPETAASAAAPVAVSPAETSADASQKAELPAATAPAPAKAEHSASEQKTVEASAPRAAHAEPVPTTAPQSIKPSAERPLASPVPTAAVNGTFAARPATLSMVSPAPTAASVINPAPSAQRPASVSAANATQREGSFLMSTSMLQQAASALRSAAKQALGQPAAQKNEAPQADAEGAWKDAPPAPRDLPELNVRSASTGEWETKAHSKARDLESA